jgi:hypothetical protein
MLATFQIAQFQIKAEGCHRYASQCAPKSSHDYDGYKISESLDVHTIVDV